ncbi:MAG: hypothetical protein AAGJ68_01435, partial [Pseudomonadota bacterium]
MTLLNKMRSIRVWSIGGAMALVGLLSACATAEAPTPTAVVDSATVCELSAPCEMPLPVKAVLVTMFEIGDDEG